MGATKSQSSPESPWRAIFEDVRRAVGNQRDEHGVLGSINWLRKQMELRGANPNVVRNIIYRDKGKLGDKRTLFEILGQLWQEIEKTPLQAPELEVLLSSGSNTEQEVMQLLGREKRRAYRTFVSGVRNDERPRLVVTGRPGSGKTLLVDYVQQALEMSPRAVDTVVRLEFNHDLATSLGRLARALGIASEAFESRLVSIGASTAFAVQADAQANVARLFIDALRHNTAPLACLFHISQSRQENDMLGLAPLRLNTPEVPRASMAEWLWHTLIVPLSKQPRVSVLVTMTELPVRGNKGLGAFEGPIKLSPPTASEARRFIKARLPQLGMSQQEEIVQRAGRSYEDLRTLTLLAEIRDPSDPDTFRTDDDDPRRELRQLSSLVETASDPRLRDFLQSLAAVSLPEYPVFREAALTYVREPKWRQLSSLEQSFLDASPGDKGLWRSFSRQFARALGEQFVQVDPAGYRQRHHRAGAFYEAGAEADPKGEGAARYLYHLLEARAWDDIIDWLTEHSAQQSLLRRIWRTARSELGTRDLETLAHHVAAHYVKLGSYEHPDVVDTLALLAASDDPAQRAWTTLKRAEGAIRRGHFEEAERLLEGWPDVDDAILNAEMRLVQAGIARWRARLEDAATLVRDHAREQLPNISQSSVAGRLIHARVAVWAGLIAKDRGQLEEALGHFASVDIDDDLMRARVAFQQGDVRMSLGRFEQARDALEHATELARQSGAIATEQTRYLSRLAHLYRRLGRLDEASDTFARALAVVRYDQGPTSALDRTFEETKVDDERALNLLARGRFDEAILVLQRNVDTFRRYQQERQVDASFRTLRSTLRLSLAYWCRAHHQPYLMPFWPPGLRGVYAPELHHARELAEDVQQCIAERPRGEERYGTLSWQAALVHSLSATPDEAIQDAQQALAWSRFAHPQAISGAYLAAAQLRQGETEACLHSIGEAQAHLESVFRESVLQHDRGAQESGDTGLWAWLCSLAMDAYAQQDDPYAVAQALSTALMTPRLARYHETLLRIFGELLVQRDEGEQVLRWLEPFPLRSTLALYDANDLIDAALGHDKMRLPDALVVHWRQQRQLGDPLTPTNTPGANTPGANTPERTSKPG